MEGLAVPFNAIKEGLSSIIEFFGTILDYLNPFSENFILLKLWNFLIDIISYINPFSDNFLGKKIVELFSDLLKFLFVPENNPFEDLKTKFDEKFAFVGQLKELVYKFFGFNKVENGDYSLATIEDYDLPRFLYYL